MATSTLATVTSFLPLDCTWNTARCSTRWKPSVGCTSRSSPAGRRGVVWSMNCFSSVFSLVVSAPQDLQDFAHLRRVDDGEQQVLDRHEFVPRLACAGERIVQAKFEFLT